MGVRLDVIVFKLLNFFIMIHKINPLNFSSNSYKNVLLIKKYGILICSGLVGKMFYTA